ncbi:MAG: hypothetical protein AAGD11_00830 [Planctomycetota bacterium]
MKISVVRNDADRLQLKLVPIAVWRMILFGLLFLTAGVLAIWALGSVTYIRLDEKKLVAEELFLNQFTVSRFAVPMDAIEKVNTKIYVSGINRSYEVSVVADTAEYPIPVASLDGDQKAALASRIDAAIKSAQPFDYSQGVGLMWTGIAVGTTAVIAGCLCLAYLQTATIIANRSSGTFEVMTKRWLLPIRPRRDCIEISSIVRLDETDFKVGSSSGSPAGTSKFVFLRTKQGHTIHLADGPMFTTESAFEIRRLIEPWIERCQRA